MSNLLEASALFAWLLALVSIFIFGKEENRIQEEIEKVKNDKTIFFKTKMIYELEDEHDKNNINKIQSIIFCICFFITWLNL